MKVKVTLWPVSGTELSLAVLSTVIEGSTSVNVTVSVASSTSLFPSSSDTVVVTVLL